MKGLQRRIHFRKAERSLEIISEINQDQEEEEEQGEEEEERTVERFHPDEYSS